MIPSGCNSQKDTTTNMILGQLEAFWRRQSLFMLDGISIRKSAISNATMAQLNMCCKRKRSFLMIRQGQTGTDRDRQGPEGTDRDGQEQTGTRKDKLAGGETRTNPEWTGIIRKQAGIKQGQASRDRTGIKQTIEGTNQQS